MPSDLIAVLGINSRSYPLGFEITLEGCWNGDTSVGLLIRFDQRHKKARQRCPAAVENMREPIFAGFGF